jgi:hypothetical protein
MTAGLSVPVARQLDEVDLVRNRDRPREVREEDEARLEQRDEQQITVGVILGDLRAELAHARVKLLRGQENVADAGVVELYDDARSNRYRCASRSMSRL